MKKSKEIGMKIDPLKTLTHYKSIYLIDAPFNFRFDGFNFSLNFKIKNNIEIFKIAKFPRKHFSQNCFHSNELSIDYFNVF
jgi:hypothetical protein